MNQIRVLIQDENDSLSVTWRLLKDFRKSDPEFQRCRDGFGGRTWNVEIVPGESECGNTTY